MYFLQANQKKLLESINPAVVVLVFYGIMVGRTTIEYVFPLFFRHWDILLPFIVYFGQRRSIAEGLTLSILTAHLYSLSSSAPIGVFVLRYLSLFIVARVLSYVIYANRSGTILMLMLVLSVFARILSVPIASIFGHSWDTIFLGGVFIGLLLNTFLGYCSYLLIGFVDRITYKSPVTNIEMAEGRL